MTVPSFLIIGAMKAGTTTLYVDLVRHPAIFMPEEKEPETLARFSSMDEIRADYRSLFKRAQPGQICGEASTSYTKRPVFEGVAQKARSVLGADARLVYLRRDPVARIVSHYRHDVQQRRTELPFAQALRTIPEYIAFSRYDWQLEPWLEMFGDESILDISLEVYSARRDETVRDVLRHIGADPQKLPGIDPSQVANSASEMKQIDNPLLNRFVRSKVYQRGIKPIFPRDLRTLARRTILPTPPKIEVIVTPEDRAYIAEMTAIHSTLIS